MEMPKASPYERLVLLTLSSSDGPLAMGQIARRVGLTKGALTTVVDRLHSASLVKRILDDEDRRIARVKLTKKGERYVARAEQRAKDEI